ncbi:tetratricopeptide repeat protein [Nonomuraea sp. NPDC049625]|uniref:tetratricopeptide repeat protein n=1 Tax=Nonomuraea sp. NPDC049625 TaxID=3155775 RepID=UPI00341EE342
MVIAAIAAMAVLLVVGLVGFFADPLPLPAQVLDQRASVVSMLIGATGLVVAVTALLLQLRAERVPDTVVTSGRFSAPQDKPPKVSASDEGAIAIGGDNPGIASSGDGAKNVLMRGQASAQGSTMYQAAGDQIHHHYPPKPEPDQIVEGDIPQRPPSFQSREQLLQRLADLLGDQAPGKSGDRGGHGGAVVICAVAGTPGVGKTLLAASYAWACQAARWPVVAWIAAETTDQILTGLDALAERLGERRADDDAAAGAARAKAWLAATTQPALLVFDNATDVAVVRRWCPATGATRVVITTRDRAFLRAFEPLEVEVFTPVQAASFLHRRTNLTDADGAAELAIELGHLPLALAQAAAVIARLHLDYLGYLELLRNFPVGDYLPAQHGDAYPAGTAEAILLSITQAETTLPFAQQLLAILAVLSPAGIPLQVLSGLSGTGNEPVRLREMLADLADTSLITFNEDGSAILMHRLVQRVLRERTAHHGDLDTILEQAVHLLHAFNATLPDGAQTWKARPAVEILIEQTNTLYRQAHANDGLTADLLTLRGQCSRYLYDLADLTRAIPLLQTTLADRERVLGADHPDTLTSRNNLASAYESAGDLGRAIPLFEATLAEQERVVGADHRYTLRSRNNLAHAYQAAGDLGRAIPLHEATLADFKRVLGADHRDTLASQASLAYAYESAGDLGRAIPLYETTLADQERALGADHPDTLGSRNNLAGAYRAAGDLGRAIPLYMATLADFKRVLGADHPHTLASQANLAGAYRTAGNLGRAIPLLVATLAERERVLGADHPDTLHSRHNLADAYREAGDLDRAIPLYEQALADRERVLGANHPQTLISRHNLASAYYSAGALSRAIPLYETTLTDQERVLGANHPDTLTSRNNLAGAYRAAGDLDRAIPLCQQTLAECERVLGADHPQTLVFRNNLAGAYEAAGDLGRAIPLFQQTLAECERVLDANHPYTLTTRHNLAHAYQTAGDLGRAIPLYEQALADCERVLGANHPTTRDVRGNLEIAAAEHGQRSAE